MGRIQDAAEKLYIKSKRYDLLNQFYQLSGQWSKVSHVATFGGMLDVYMHPVLAACPQAMEVAETKDRIHLKTTYYNYGRHAEDMGEINAAINRCPLYELLLQACQLLLFSMCYLNDSLHAAMKSPTLIGLRCRGCCWMTPHSWRTTSSKAKTSKPPILTLVKLVSHFLHSSDYPCSL